MHLAVKRTTRRAAIAAPFAVCTALMLGACQESTVAPTVSQPALTTSVVGDSPVKLKSAPTRLPSGPQFASQINNPVDPSVIVSYNGLEWVWASPCALNGCTSGILVGKDGFQFANAAQWALRPPVTEFIGKCASPWFDLTWDHCDYSDAVAGYYGSVPAGGTGQVGSNAGTNVMNPAAETWLVRGGAITANIVGTLGNNGWYTSDVSLTWTITDPLHTVLTTTNCGPQTVTSNTAGVTFTCSATTTNGPISQSVTIKRDATPPVVDVAGAVPQYTIDKSVFITCNATDDLSGIASSSCQNVSGKAYTFPLGLNNYPMSVTDNAGNTTSKPVQFLVKVTYPSLQELTQDFVNNAGVAATLNLRLIAASGAASGGNIAGARIQLNLYISTVKLNAGRTIIASKAALLVVFANALAGLPTST